MHALPRIKRVTALRVGAWLVILFAVTPNLVYLGHGPLSVNAGNSHAATAHHHPSQIGGDAGAQPSEHTQHCHTGPAKCAGSQSLVGSIWVGEDAGLLTLNSVARAVPAAEAITDIQLHSEKILQPPKQAV